MEKILYRGKTYIKIKQDWYSDIGAKQPLKLAVELDALYHEKMLKESANLIELVDQGRHYVSVGQPQKAYDVFLMATQLALQYHDVNHLLVVLPRLVSVSSSVNMQAEVFALLQKWEEHETLQEQPHFKVALATLCLSLEMPEKAFDYVLEATLLFKVQKKKMSDEAMMVWSHLKKHHPLIYKQVGDKLKAERLEP